MTDQAPASPESVPAAQPSADVVRALERLEQAVVNAWPVIEKWLPRKHLVAMPAADYEALKEIGHAHRALAAAREAGPPAAATLPRHTCRHGIEPCEACAAAEPADEGLRLLRAVRDADVIFAKGDWPLSQEINAYLAAHPEPTNAPTRRTNEVPRADS